MFQRCVETTLEISLEFANWQVVKDTLAVIPLVYPPGNEFISHLWKRTTIFKTIVGKGYVSSQQGTGTILFLFALRSMV